jgi:hypothetical protein
MTILAALPQTYYSTLSDIFEKTVDRFAIMSLYAADGRSFEPLIYNSIQVYNKAPTPPRAFSVAGFKHIVESLNNVRRRSMVRKLVFHYQATQFSHRTGRGRIASLGACAESH